MEFTRMEAFRVVGIAARTSFQRENRPGGAIPPLWDRFIKESVFGTIPSKADARVLALYTDYESDEYGEYTLVLGAKVSSPSDPPEGMVSRHVPASEYAIFPSPRGPIESVVIETWKQIWKQSPTPDYERSYRSDFELYDERAANPADAQIEIYVGVK